jgi:hypothetical protein
VTLESPGAAAGVRAPQVKLSLGTAKGTSTRTAPGTGHGRKGTAISPSPSPSPSASDAPAAPLAQPASTTTYDSATVTAVAADADWILRCQLSDGAITTQTDHHAVWPYLANFAAQGLAQASRVTGRSTYVDAAWRWLAWYAAHEDSRGFVTDYEWSGSAMVSTGSMDSTDAYAGTFLSAVRAAWLVDPDRTSLTSLHTGITRAVSAIEATVDVDGMTWAKPSWHVKYLMDLAETYAGLRSAAELATVLGDSALETRATALARQMLSGIATLWDTSESNYHYAKYDSGVLQRSSWSYLYPDALEQAWAAAYGVSDSARTSSLVADFVRAQPRWDEPAASAAFNSGVETVGYWPVAGWALLRAGQTDAALSAASSIRAAAVAVGRVWPYTSGNSGQLILLESRALDLVAP